ncbi:fimbrial protein [Aeromonas salmonicida]
MNLYKTTLAAFLSIAFLPMSNAATGTVNVTGNIVEPACTLTGGASTENVVMGNVGKDDFANAGVGAPVAARRFDFDLSCSKNGNATVVFNGASDPVNINFLQLTQGSNTAQGVAVAFYDTNGTKLIPLGVQSAVKPVTGTQATPGKTQVTFFAAYVATVSPEKIVNGEANAVANFTVLTN